MLQAAKPRALSSTERDDPEDYAIPERAGIALPSLRRFWRGMYDRRRLMAAIIGSFVLMGVLATLLATPHYTATTRIKIDREEKKVTNVSGIESSDAGRDLEFYQTQYALLAARSLAERVATSLKLASSDAFFAAHGVNPDQSSPFAFGHSSADGQKRQKQAIELLRTHVAIAPVRGSALVDISYTSASPELSAQIANAWTQQFIQASLDRRFASTADARRFLEDRLSALKGRLQDSERDVVGYASKSGIVALSQQTGPDGKTEVDRTLITKTIETVNDELSKATADRIAAESRAKDRASTGANADALGNTTIATLREKRAEVAADYARMLVQFEPGYPPAKALSEQVHNLDASIAREEQRVLNSHSADYTVALAREHDLQQQLVMLKAELNRQQAAGIQYNIYEREADTNRELYNGLLQRYKEIGVAGVDANNIAIVDPAVTPAKPSSPDLKLNLSLALLLGILASIATTVALEHIDEGLRDPRQVTDLLHVALLGSVPFAEGEEPRDALSDTKSPLYEAYLSIRSNLAFSSDHGVPNSLLVTSTRAGEGKSVTALAIATVLARTGKRVLILDADMRSPSLHTYLGAANTVGLSNYLAGGDDWQSLLAVSPVQGLSAMFAGPMPPNAAELLSTDRITSLLALVCAHFDHVVVDCAPVLGLADAPLLSRAVEGCIFVIEAGGAPVRAIQQSIDRLRSVHAHLIGAVFSKLRYNHSPYGYGHGYGYGYGRNKADTQAEGAR